MATRYLINDYSNLLNDPNPRSHLVQSLTKLLRGCPPKDPGLLTDDDVYSQHGLYRGPTSIAYLFLWVSRTHPNLLIEGKPAMHWCKYYLVGPRKFVPPKPDKCGVMNEQLAYWAVTSAVMQRALEFEDMQTMMIEQLTSGGLNEWLYGCAGLLYLLRVIRHWVPQTADELLIPIKKIIDHILAQAPWSWHGKDYIGAVHGDIGIMTQIILSDPSYKPALEPRLSYLLELQDKTGNWPSAASSTHNALVQFCHGAPGFVISLMALGPHFPNLQSRIDRAIESGRRCILEKGFLVKEPNLCHGITGNALALASPQLEHMMAYTTGQIIGEFLKQGKYKASDDLFGLFCGEAGRAWGWVVADGHFEVGLIGYTDI